MSQDRLEPKVTDILRKNSLMGMQVRGRSNETDEMDSRGKVCGSDEMPSGLKTVSESRKHLLARPFATKPSLDLLFVNLG